MRFSQPTHLLMFLSLETNVYHKDWLTYSGGTDQPGELCNNFPNSSDLTQMVNFPTWPLSSDASIFSTMAFPLMGNSDLVVVSVSIDFPSNSQHNALLHYIAYDYSCADWEGHCDHWRDIHGRILGASGVTSEFC